MVKNIHCLRPGTRLIGHYVIYSVLGQGGFGITYMGMDELHQTKVAIKEYFPQGIVTRNVDYGDDITITYVGQEANYLNGKQHFIDEAHIMLQFDKNQGIVDVIDFFEVNNTAYIVMEYLDGITLKQYLKEKGRISAEDIQMLMVPLMESLDEIHSQGLIHRDISPDNIMVLSNGDIKLMDFGAARAYTDFGERSLSVVLKPGYAPPEQYQTHGVQGPWTDIYALCATIYKCITGKTPPDAIQRVMDDTLQLPSDFGVVLPASMEMALIKGMNISPQQRYQDMKSFCDDFYRMTETAISEQRMKEKAEPQEKMPQHKSSFMKIAAVLLCIVLGCGGIGYYFAAKDQTKEPSKITAASSGTSDNTQLSIENPIIEEDSSMEAGQKVTWDCLWFGCYPQEEITEDNGAIYTNLKNTEDWDQKNDVTIDGIKYHKRNGAYFQYKPIKWRVLKKQEGEVFLIADAVLTKKPYNEKRKSVTWENSTLRTWLNKNFMNLAFSEEEQTAINQTEMKNRDNLKLGTKGGNKTFDKIFLLSQSQVYGTTTAEEYGFVKDSTCKDEARKGKNITGEKISWWLRSPGKAGDYAACVSYDGWIHHDGCNVSCQNDGIRPVLHLNLAFLDVYSYAGTVCSDGTEEEVKLQQ